MPAEQPRVPQPTSSPIPTPTATPTPTSTPTPSTTGTGAPRPVQTFSPRVIRWYPHPENSYTQGLIYRGGTITESVGLTGQGGIYRYALGSSSVQSRYRNPWPNVFFEGIDQDGDRIVLLTWLNNWTAIYNSDLVLQKQIPSSGEGWGICFDGQVFYKSNGSSSLQKLNRETLAVEKSIPVSWNGTRVSQLNELECVNGYVMANIYYSTNIVIIDPTTGKVQGVINGAGISRDQLNRNSDAVLNGIAYRSDTKTLVLTGKMWTQMVEIELPEL